MGVGGRSEEEGAAHAGGGGAAGRGRDEGGVTAMGAKEEAGRGAGAEEWAAGSS